MKLTGFSVLGVGVFVGFTIISFMALRPDILNIKDTTVVMYLLGAWQGMAMVVLQWHYGSSAGSARKDEQIHAATAQVVDSARASTAAAATVAANVVAAAAESNSDSQPKAL